MKLNKRTRRLGAPRVRTPREKAEHVCRVFHTLKNYQHHTDASNAANEKSGQPTLLDQHQIVKNYKNRIIEMADSAQVSNAIESTILVAIRDLPPHLVNALQVELHRHMADQPVEPVLEVA